MLHFRVFTVAGWINRGQQDIIEYLRYAWPLNVRQVVQAARRAALLLDRARGIGGEQLAEILEQPAASGEQHVPVPGAPADEALPAVGRAPREAADSAIGRRRGAWLRRHWSALESLLEQMHRNGGNVSAAARAIGISRQQAQRLLAAKAEMDGEA
jgi:transcriptional regulator of acetoin/glycerol metabolism